jgi:CDP-glucose 4,6-dehydratase
MESLGIIDRPFWKGKRVVVTGHTGFKGAWLALWLRELGAHVIGISDKVPTTPSLYEAITWGEHVESYELDIRDGEKLATAISRAKPEIILHLAAQSLVRASYQDPVGTFATNIMGTIHVFEAARRCPSVKAVVNVTSDKCYENQESSHAFREGDRIGGRDPYSCSKACAELVTTAYQRSFFIGDAHRSTGERRIGLASVRAGNVFGGGDWSSDRLIPDCVRSFSTNTPVVIRNPESIRPWQHVLDAVRGYILVAQNLYAQPEAYSEPFNFGPDPLEAQSVASLVTGLTDRWGGSASWQRDASPEGTHPHEATLLRLDSTFAQRKLNWKQLIPLTQGLDLTVAWYRAFLGGDNMTPFTIEQIKFVESLESAKV